MTGKDRLSGEQVAGPDLLALSLLFFPFRRLPISLLFFFLIVGMVPSLPENFQDRK